MTEKIMKPCLFLTKPCLFVGVHNLQLGTNNTPAASARNISYAANPKLSPMVACIATTMPGKTDQISKALKT